ncbi:MAG: hypothetical protein LBJ72_09995 [Dysgonamonadaceae bacterium]|jgi:hypothetical protein|nr:hypothetical protein [Dysgonamonadaceae bacterium]
MRRYAAHYVFLGKGIFLKQHYLELDDNSRIIGVRPLENEIAGTVFHNGILFPVSKDLKLQSSTILDSLKTLSQHYPGDPVFQLLHRSGLVCEDRNIPVSIFQLDGIDLHSLVFSPDKYPDSRIQQLS